MTRTKLYHTDKGPSIKATIKDNDLVVLDIPCPVGCGHCCAEDWKKATAFKILLKELTSVWECPFLAKQGCTLPRADRPIECTAHICELGQLANANLVTKEEIEETIQSCRQSDAAAYLSKQL